MPSDINSTGAIPVQSGTANQGSSWLLTSTVATVGTDALTYTRFSYPATGSAESVLNSTGKMLYASAANVLAGRAIGTTNQGLLVSGGLPVWGASPTSVLTTTGDVLYASA